MRRAVARLDDAVALGIRHNLIRSLRVVMPILMLLTVGSTLAEAIISPAPARFSAALGAGATLAVLIVTLSVHSPLNRVFLRWQPETMPANGSALIARWNRWDSVRVCLALLAFAATANAVVIR